MLKRLRTAHPILYCILAEVLFLGSLFLSSLVLTVALVAAGADFSGLDEYLLSLVQELVGAGAAWLPLRRTGRQGLLAAAAAAFGTVCWWGCTRWHSSATAYTAH